MLEIRLGAPDDFLKVRETLSRIGISSKSERNTLTQSCHILHKQGRYFIVHFKELFLLDGKPANLTLDDVARRNVIAQLLSDWGLLSLVKPIGTDCPVALPPVGLENIKVLKHSEVPEWTLKTKYAIGNVKKPR